MQVEKIEGETSIITIVCNTAWFVPKEEDYSYVKTETEYLLELLGYDYQQTTDPKTLIIKKLDSEQIKELYKSFTGLKNSFRWLAFWSEIKIE